LSDTGTAIDTEHLRHWLADTVEGLDLDAPIEVELISGGQSNLTMGLRVGDIDLVLRRPPLGAFLPSANDMQREYTFLSALASTSVPTPRPLGLCDDPAVIGAPFYVMERLHGVVPHEPSVLAGLSADEGRRLSEQVVDVLVDLHRVDPDAVGLGAIAKRTGYLERQVRRWVDQYERAKDGRDEPQVDELVVVLQHNQPEAPTSTIVHGDYRLGNLMLDADDRTRIVGVFDWEMATLGDPLADLGYTVLSWGTRGHPTFHASQACADGPGFLSTAELAERYSTRSGRSVDDLVFYVVLAAFKLSVIRLVRRAVQRRGGTVDADLERTDLPLAGWALDLWNSSGHL
jgi:aminoglycoside phosphotransferase (APT) family kinase protein